MDRRAYRNKILAYFMPRVLLKFRLVFTNVLKVLRKKETVRERERKGEIEIEIEGRERESGQENPILTFANSARSLSIFY